jgi:glutamate N-acetyltransferase / amino-acid N-acetyltransferase
LKQVTQKTFNRISVDNDMSTNDTVLILANGMSGNAFIRKKDKDYQCFYAALEAICFYIAKDLVRDGEGVTKVCDISVIGAKNEKQAEHAARAIADSMLFKTALNGADPNWGRIVAALGASNNVGCACDKITICFDHVAVMRRGKACVANIKSAGRRMQKKEVFLTVDLGVGKAEAHILTSDLSKKYIEINADYTT